MMAFIAHIVAKTSVLPKDAQNVELRQFKMQKNIVGTAAALLNIKNVFPAIHLAETISLNLF